MQVQGGDAGAYTARMSDVAELVDVYTRQLLAGALFLPLEKLDCEAPGTPCAVEIQLPLGTRSFRVEAVRKNQRANGGKGSQEERRT